MNLNWANLRTLDGSQHAAFEELCCQLARSETPANARFIRKGNPDAGVECLSVLENDTEWGWQAKFFEQSPKPAQWGQMDRSVKSALDAHPRLARYFVCMPRNRADGRRPGIKTEMQKWDEHVVKWNDWAVDRGMKVDFVWWGASELWERLSQKDHAGLLEFWFGNLELFIDSWFKARLDEAVASAGSRYSPELHVDLPIAQKFELFGRTNTAMASVLRHAKDIRRACSYGIRRHATEDSSDDSPSLKSLADACDEVLSAMSYFDCPPDQQWRVSDICQRIQNALDLGARSDQALATAERLHEESNQERETEHARRTNPFRDARHALHHLEGQLWATLDDLSAREPFINTDLLIINGEAGTGKTHLLCDVAADRITRGLPTVVLMGQRFLSKEDPWKQVLDQLDLSTSSADVFVGALEAAAQVVNSRALVIIDAINEGEGDGIWRAHLAPFLARLQRSPWIGVVLSVRTPYLKRVVTRQVLESARVLTHHGFEESTYAAVRRYCEQFDLEFPTTPLLRPEFDNPLFLKTLCESLHSTGKRRFPVGAEGITQIFDRYLDGVNAKAAESLGLDPLKATVRQALDSLAAALAERETRWVPRSDAQSIVNAHAPQSDFSRSLYRALLDHGLLIEVLPGGQGAERAVQFGFEWFADHLIAAHFVDAFADTESLAGRLARGDADSIAIRLMLTPGLLDALSILLPECHNIEMPDALRESTASWLIDRSFHKTLPWRAPDTIGVRCHELVNDAFDSLEGYELQQLLDALVTCATIPGHPLGAESLDNRLRRIPMPDRDAVWSTYLHYAYGQGGTVDRVLDWAERLHTAKPTTDPQSVWACAVVLTWFLTTSNRFVRDRATKGLVSLLDGDFETAARLVRDFHNVDDPYVCERVMAAAYGIAMRSTDARGLAPLAEAVYEEVFAERDPPVHYLLRDYARGVIERALYLGANLDIDRSRVEPPYQSDWPHIPDEAELEEIDPSEIDPAETPSDADRARGRIRFSVMHWDFARYTIGTNFSAGSHSWLSVPLHSSRWRSRDEQLEDFLDSLDKNLQTSFRRLIQRNSPNYTSVVFSALTVTSDLALTDQGETDEPDFAFIVNPEMASSEQAHLRILTDEQKGQYDELLALRDYEDPRLDLDIIQRYVLWRAFDLGWTSERFGDFDWSLAGGPSHLTQKAERVGKKYQWIALHEILALISDHYQYRDGYTNVDPLSEYHGPWQSSRRDIDPSFLRPPALDHRSENDVPSNSWANSEGFDWGEDLDAHGWIDRKDDLPDICQLLRFRPDGDGATWLKLFGFPTWRQPSPPTHDQWEIARREVWVNVTGYLVERGAVAETLDLLRRTDFWNNRLPEPATSSKLFFGEVGWSPAFRDLMSEFDYEGPHGNADWPRSTATLRPVAMCYLFEGAGYDCSLSESVTLYRPEWQTDESMRLKWTGKGADFANTAGELVASDPSAFGSGPPALIIRESDFAAYLEANGLTLIWKVQGERCAFSPGRPNTWDGSLQFWGAYEYTPSGPQGKLETRLQLPDDN